MTYRPTWIVPAIGGSVIIAITMWLVFVDSHRHTPDISGKSDSKERPDQTRSHKDDPPKQPGPKSIPFAESKAEKVVEQLREAVRQGDEKAIATVQAEIAGLGEETVRKIILMIEGEPDASFRLKLLAELCLVHHAVVLEYCQRRFLVATQVEEEWY